MAILDDEERLLRSVALEKSASILRARQRAEEELLQAREALRQSEERLQAALNASGTGTFRWNLQTNVVEWDGNLDRLFGLRPLSAVQSLDVFIAAVHPDDQPEVVARLDRSVRERSDVDMEFRVVWPDGSIHWIEEKARIFLDRDGAPSYMTGACADVTSRKAAAETLRENEERLRAIFNQAAVGIAVSSLDGHFLDMNRKFSDILGFPPDELRQRTFFAITHPDDAAETQAAARELLAGSIPEYSLEKRYIRRDGTVVWSLSTVTLLRNASGEPQRFIGVIEDITARKRVEAALQEETRILELLNRTGRTVASTLDLHDLVQGVTDAATELSGAMFGAFFYKRAAGPDDSLRIDAQSGSPPADFAALASPLLGQAIQKGSPIRCDDTLQDPLCGDGVFLRAGRGEDATVRSYLALPVRSRSSDVIGGLLFGHPQPAIFTERSERLIVGLAAQAGVAIDNARLYEAAQKAAEERKALLESERAARSAAERMSEIKDEFLATLSHELRTPLNAILGWSQILRNVTKDHADLVRGLETIERNARAQTQLIEDLLDMNRITSGKLRLDIQPIQPASFIEAALETVKPAADARGISLETVLDREAGSLSGDPGRLQQVIWNLLSNAIKFTPRGGKVQVVLTRVQSHVEISVADTGIGISPEFLPHLFERFRQADASTTRLYGGLGLGLSIVKRLVELHGGTVTARSAGEGLGTTITVQLPLKAVSPRDDENASSSKATDTNASSFIAAELSGLTILVVDDQSDARDLIRRVLEGCAANVVTAATVDEALRFVETLKPDVLVSAIGMPGEDGFDLIRRVRRLGPERGGKVPAIALTAFARSQDRTRVLRAGFLVHMAKPVDPSELVATVATVAGRAKE